VPNFVAAEVSYLAGTVSLMPICGDKDPSALADLRQESFVGCSCIRGNVLLVDAISDPALMKFFDDLGAVPVFVKVEG
jgi:hypothetical protein